MLYTTNIETVHLSYTPVEERCLLDTYLTLIVFMDPVTTIPMANNIWYVEYMVAAVSRQCPRGGNADGRRWRVNNSEEKKQKNYMTNAETRIRGDGQWRAIPVPHAV